MATKVFMEALSPTMEEGRIVKWLKKEGDTVANGDLLAEVETDKAVMELSARGDGVLRKVIVPEGGTAPVASVVGIIAAADEDISALEKEAGGGATKAAPPAAEANKGEAAKGGAAEAAATAEPAPSDAPVPAGEHPGAASTKQSDAKGATPPAPAAPQGKAEQAPVAAGERPRSSPLARRIAGDKGIDLSAVQGSGPAGRIIKR